MTPKKDEKNTKKRRSPYQKKLDSALNTIAAIIDSLATAMKEDIDGGIRDVKQLKELTGAAKELSLLISANESKEPTEGQLGITVRFEGEGEDWAR